MNSDEPQRVSFVINTDEFIEEVKRHPAIWNYKSSEYNDKLNRLNYWSEIGEKFFDNFNEKGAEDKCEITSFLQKKWKHLRDNFTRYLLNVKKCEENGTRKPKTYTYFHNLTFLLSLTDMQLDTEGIPSKYKDILSISNENREKTAVDSTDTESQESPKAEIRTRKQQDTGGTPLKCKEIPMISDFAGNATGIEVPAPKTKTRKRKKSTSNEDILVNKITKKINKQLENTKDEDRLFLLSLNSEFKKISDEYKLDARLEILQVIRKYKNLSEHILPATIFLKEELV